MKLQWLIVGLIIGVATAIQPWSLPVFLLAALVLLVCYKRHASRVANAEQLPFVQAASRFWTHSIRRHLVPGLQQEHVTRFAREIHCKLAKEALRQKNTFLLDIGVFYFNPYNFGLCQLMKAAAIESGIGEAALLQAGPALQMRVEHDKIKVRRFSSEDWTTIWRAGEDMQELVRYAYSYACTCAQPQHLHRYAPLPAEAQYNANPCF